MTALKYTFNSHLEMRMGNVVTFLFYGVYSGNNIN
jgi:hypothetical protein